MKSMKDQYGSKRGEQVFYASMNKGKIKGVEKKKNGGLGQKSGPPPKKGPASQGITVKKLSVGGGADMGGGAASGSSGSSGSAGGGGGRDAGMGMGGKTRSGGRDAGMGMGGKTRSTSTIKSSKPQNSSKKTITPKKQPFQFPVIGPTTFIANKIIKSTVQAKNLKEQKEEDVLGGEMLTTGKRTNTPNIGGERGGDARDIRPSATVQPIKITPASVPIPLMKVQPKMFPFEYKEGGLVRGSGKVLKGRVKKAKIY